MVARNFKDLKAWQAVHHVALDVYRCTADFPIQERYALVNQMRRAVVSAAANLVEGFKRRTNRDRLHFYVTSRSSAEELKYYLILSRDLGYLKAGPALDQDLDRACALIHGLIESAGGPSLEWGV